ncbi:SOS response-associated peptidase [Stackebrandtia soli]|uniref:SOS response-associated peptidase n=1 Tax=Stackebrandtia soli TaxID=1892856 RepID=UPI0039EC9182
MCGRYASTRSSTDLATLFDAVDDTDGRVVPGFNIAPTMPVPIVRRSRRKEERVVSAAVWGLVPPWAADPSSGARMINARVETVTTARSYRTPFRRKRCLVPADGWYEWQKLSNGKKQPYYMTDPSGDPLVFAGLWEFWGRGDEGIMTCTVLTTEAVGDFARVHDRMPFVLAPERIPAWLGEVDAEVDELLRPAGMSYLSGIESRPVSRAVGNVRNDGPQLIERSELSSEGGEETQQQTLF